MSVIKKSSIQYSPPPAAAAGILSRSARRRLNIYLKTQARTKIPALCHPFRKFASAFLTTSSSPVSEDKCQGMRWHAFTLRQIKIKAVLPYLPVAMVNHLINAALMMPFSVPTPPPPKFGANIYRLD